MTKPSDGDAAAQPATSLKAAPSNSAMNAVGGEVAGNMRQEDKKTEASPSSIAEGEEQEQDPQVQNADSATNRTEDEENSPTAGPTAVWNPRGLTLKELDMHLYEWERDAEPVREYLDMRVIEKLRTGEHSEDYGYSKSKDEGRKKPKGWLGRLKEKAKEKASIIGGGLKAKAKSKKDPTHYLDLTDGAAHVVEFYAPW